MPRTHLRRRTLAALLACCVASISIAQEPYPSRPITWVVGYPPGGSVDLITRVVARKIEKTLGQPVVVENRPGATGAIALRHVVERPADGYTLITVPGPVMTNVPLPQLGKELAPVAMLARGATVLVGPARPDAPQDLKALLADARANPRKYSYASSGTGTGQHLTGELINATAGTQIVHVPYRGGGQAVTDVVGGQIPLAVLGITPVLPHIKAGRLKAYGVSTSRRSPALAEVPTLREAGLAGFEAEQWFVLGTRQGVPADRVAGINAAVTEALKDPEIQEVLEKQGLFSEPSSPQQTAAFLQADLRRWNDLVRKANISLD